MSEEIKAYVGYNERINRYYERTFTIVDAPPKVGDIYKSYGGIEEIVESVRDFSIDPDNDIRRHSYQYYKVTTRDTDEHDTRKYYIAVPFSDPEPEEEPEPEE